MKIVISQQWGGLGDNLQFSTLPEAFTKAGHTVYLSSQNAYSNKDIYDLVWKNNPYILGIVDDPPNAGSCVPFSTRTNIFMHDMELAHGITPDCVRKYPLIYYTPKLLEEYADAVVLDISSISLHSDYLDNIPSLTRMVHDLCARYPDAPILQVCNFPQLVTEPNARPINVDNLHHYSDIIASCRVYVALISGSNSLVSAVKQDSARPHAYSLVSKNYEHILPRGFYAYSNVEYVVI